MSTDTGLLMKDTEEHMRKSIAHLESELAKIRAGKAFGEMLFLP